MHSPFSSFLQAGFECSCHRFPDGRRLDLIESTGHASWAASDYAAAVQQGIRTVRDGVRWHLVGRSPRGYDWSSLRPLIAAANVHRMQVIWDLCHYGWPDWLDIWSPRFPEEFARYAAAAARLLSNESTVPPLYCPINEISYWSWAGGDMAHFSPCTIGRGAELKRQLVRAAIQASNAILEAHPTARLLAAEPLIAVHPGDDADEGEARHADAAKFQAWDMLVGRLEPELGGDPRYLDILGLNYYPYNQWQLGGPTVALGHPQYRPLRHLLSGTHRRYGKPMLIAETGAEGDARAPWLQYVADEVAGALHEGLPIMGICLYPVTDYPGWEDDRHCATGLFGTPLHHGLRPLHLPLAKEVQRQARRFEALRASGLATGRSPLPSGATGE